MVEARAVRWILAAIVLGSIAVRLGLMVPALGRLEDPDNYLDLARSIVEGRGYSLNGRPTAYRPPLYPILLTPLVASLSRAVLPWGVGCIHLTLGVGTVLLVYLTARRWGFSRRRALFAAGVVAFDPVLASQSRVVMTESLAAFLASATLASFTWSGLRGVALGGLCFGFATLCRPSFLPLALSAGLAALLFGPGHGRLRVVRSVILIGATLLALLPWALRNQVIFGEPVWTTTHGGYTLALANNGAYYQDVLDGPPDAVWGGVNQKKWMLEVDRTTSGMSDVEADRFLRSEALQMLKNRPRDFARASIARLRRFWGISPSGLVYGRWVRWFSAAWTIPLWVALAFGFFRAESWRWPAVVAPMMVMALTAVHLVYWTDMRMRAPVIPAIALLAAGPWLDRSPRIRANAAIPSPLGLN